MGGRYVLVNGRTSSHNWKIVGKSEHVIDLRVLRTERDSYILILRFFFCDAVASP